MVSAVGVVLILSGIVFVLSVVFAYYTKTKPVWVMMVVISLSCVFYSFVVYMTDVYQQGELPKVKDLQALHRDIHRLFPEDKDVVLIQYKALVDDGFLSMSDAKALEQSVKKLRMKKIDRYKEVEKARKKREIEEMTAEMLSN